MKHQRIRFLLVFLICPLLLPERGFGSSVVVSPTRHWACKVERLSLDLLFREDTSKPFQLHESPTFGPLEEEKGFPVMGRVEWSEKGTYVIFSVVTRRGFDLYLFSTNGGKEVTARNLIPFLGGEMDGLMERSLPASVRKRMSQTSSVPEGQMATFESLKSLHWLSDNELECTVDKDYYDTVNTWTAEFTLSLTYRGGLWKMTASFQTLTAGKIESIGEGGRKTP